MKKNSVVRRGLNYSNFEKFSHFVVKIDEVNAAGQIVDIHFPAYPNLKCAVLVVNFINNSTDFAFRGNLRGNCPIEQ